MKRVITRYCQVYKKLYILIFLTNDGNAWSRAANSPKPRNPQIKYTVTLVVTRLSYGKVLH